MHSDTQVMGVTDHFLLGFTVHSTKWNPHLVPWSAQEAVARQIIDPRRKSTIIIQLNGHSIKLTPNDLSLYSIICEAISSGNWGGGGGAQSPTKLEQKPTELSLLEGKS